jgi:signal recognition particle subunit SRP54
MFDGLTQRFQEIFRKLRGKGWITEDHIREALRDVRIALLEADVNLNVVKDFLERVRERALGQEVLRALTPDQQVIKIVKEELTRIMGGSRSEITFSQNPPTILMLVGLQGSGKTTVAAKLARKLKADGKNPILVAADVYRPAAKKQLQVLGNRIQVPVYEDSGSDPVEIAVGSVEYARGNGYNVVILDTAGRLHIDEEMMEELIRMKKAINPTEVLLVADAMTGQDAVNIAIAFERKVGIDGVILTKLDGDARGGAALSIKAVTGKPIKFVGVGEKLDALEPFHPDRMASRILGMGDILTLIEKAEAAMDKERAEELERKLREERFTLEDFRDQLRQLREMGPLDQLLSMIPGLKAMGSIQVDERRLKRIEAIIDSMTPEERENPYIIDGSRRRRIAMGSGTSIQDVNMLLNQFEAMKKVMKQMGVMGAGRKRMQRKKEKRKRRR